MSVVPNSGRDEQGEFAPCEPDTRCVVCDCAISHGRFCPSCADHLSCPDDCDCLAPGPVDPALIGHRIELLENLLWG